MSAGISFVAGDRLHESLIPGMMVRENLFMNPCKHGHALFSRYNEKSEAPLSREKIRQFDVRPAQINIEISALSGGNQQKVVMARWLSLNAPLLITEDPSAGVDVGARAEIYDLLNQALQNGVAILVISNDLEEVAHICNRALVFNRGQIVGELLNQMSPLPDCLSWHQAAAPYIKSECVMAKTSMKSTAPNHAYHFMNTARLRLGQLTTRYGLPAICVVLVIVFH